MRVHLQYGETGLARKDGDGVSTELFDRLKAEPALNTRTAAVVAA